MSSSLTASQIQKAFKIIGKHIQLSQIAAASAAQYQGHIMATVAQGISGVSGEYADFSKSIAPLQGQLDGLIGAYNIIPGVAKAAIDNYLQQSLAVDMGITAGSTSATVLATLITQMAAATPAQTVLTAGVYFQYFFTNYAISFVQAGSPTILDAWVSSSVV